MNKNGSAGSFEESEPRRDLHIDAEKYDQFNELQTSQESPFYGAENHDLFMFTVGYGRKHNEPEKIQNNEHAFFGRPRLSDTQKTVLEAVAIVEEGTVEVLQDRRYVFQLAEKFANGGIDELHDRVFQTDEDPMGELTLEIKETHDADA